MKISNPNCIYSKVTGSWTSMISFDGLKYWDLELIDPATLIKTNDPLPSDCRYREDLNYLAKKDLEKSQEHKIRLEVIQRADRKLRQMKNEKKKH